MNVIFSRLDQVDWDTTHQKVVALNHVDELNEHKEGTFLLPVGENLSTTTDYHVFIPVNDLAKYDHESVSVYFDLEIYPFFQKAKEVIEQETERRGVFRFRRMVNENTGLSLLAGDLYVLAELFGEPENISIKKTSENTLPIHVIVLVNFGGGTMAHIEYTVTNHERIELEWSGMNHIIEFDSDEMSPFQPVNQTALPLAYSLDSIMEKAHKVDNELIEKLNKYSNLIAGGEQ